MISVLLSAGRSLRILRKHWKLTAIAVFSLSIAMALGVVGLSVSNTALLLPPSAPEPDRLVTIYSHSADEAAGQISYPDYKYYRDNNHVFTDIAAAPNSISIDANSDGAHEVKVVSRPVSDNYFAVLGIRPFLGHFFAPGDDQSKEPLAVMTYSCWQRLGAEPNIAGKSVGGSTIVGVAPKEFTGSFYGVNGDLLTSLSRVGNNADWFAQRDSRQLFLTARLKPGVSRSQAQAEMAALSGRLATAYPKEDKNRTAIVARATLLPPDGVAAAELVTGILMAVVLLVLLIACANVANLLLAVAVGRRQEAAIKLALGAPRGRLIREFLRESTILCVASAALGYAIAAAAIARFTNFTITLPNVGAYSFGIVLKLDATVAAFAVALMLIAILATGLAPALYASSPAVAQILSGEIVVGGTRKSVRRNVLVILQVAVCTLVLVGMGLCERDLYNLRHVDPGFSARNLVSMMVFPMIENPSEAQGREFHATVRAAVAALPGVESIALAQDVPLMGANPMEVQFPETGNKAQIANTVVDGDYFATLGIRVLAGRVFDSRDRENGPDAIVINRKMADQFWPGRDPIGQSVIAGDPGRKATVVGVVADGKYEDLDEPPRPFFYYALSQHYQGGINLIARTKGDPRLWVDPLARTSRSLGLFSLAPPATFDHWMDITLLGERITAGCAAALSGLGLVLAVIGLFGAISYSVSERKKELGIRVALGARPGQLLKMVLRQTLVIAGTGVAIGIVLGIGVTMLVRSEFYNVAAVEWTVLVPVSVAMLAISLTVAYISARPWISINPMEAVRHA
ncbi:MAG TPA: ADOP family duplicated permease [Bryobacteraceae bacterium]|jgi:putative ABC transport system permease protein